MNVTVTDAEIAKKRAEIVDQSGLRQTLSLPATASLADVDAALTKAGEPDRWSRSCRTRPCAR